MEAGADGDHGYEDMTAEEMRRDLMGPTGRRREDRATAAAAKRAKTAAKTGAAKTGASKGPSRAAARLGPPLRVPSTAAAEASKTPSEAAAGPSHVFIAAEPAPAGAAGARAPELSRPRARPITCSAQRPRPLHTWRAHSL